MILLTDLAQVTDVGRVRTGGRRLREVVDPDGALLDAEECDRPPRYTDAHHLVPWTAGGATDLGNGALLCRYHHRLVHKAGWTVVPIDPTSGSNGALRFISPTGSTLISPVRGP